MLKLTPRQQTFLDNLFELYREFQGPVHYSVVAEKLGVNKFSAYDMLKVLEEKGVAASSYVLSDNQSGPGRSQVVFYPTNKAAQFLTQLRDEVRNSADWQTVKRRILKRLEDARGKSTPSDSLRESLAKLTDDKNPLNYCAEMISIQLLALSRVRNQSVAPVMDTLKGQGQIALGMLAGMSLASLMNHTDDLSLTEKLVTHTNRFKQQLAEMSDDSISKLSMLLNDGVMTLQLA